MTVTGEILDMGCYATQGLHGPVHRTCALQCLSSSVPMGLLAADSTIYLLTQFHDRAMAPSNFPPPDPYLQCRNWASFQVEISGMVSERRGMKYLEVMSSKPAPPANPN